MTGLVRTILAVLAALLLCGLPRSVAAAPFCVADGPPVLGTGFAALAARLEPNVGEPSECEHPDGDSGDVLQHTAGGLLYWRKSTNTPTFTNGTEHWALRDDQILNWTGDAVDPPANSAVAPPAPNPVTPATAAPTNPSQVPTAARVPAAAAPPAALPAVPAPDVAGALGLVLAILGAFVLLVALAIGASAFRRRRPQSFGGGNQVRLAATSTLPASDDTALATRIEHGPTSVHELQGALHDIGKGSVSEHADAVLRADFEPMVWHDSPSAVALLLTAALKWLLVFLVDLFVVTAFGWSWLALVVPMVVAAVWLGRNFIRYRTTVYRVSSQRLEIQTGIFNQQSITRELHEMTDALIDRPFVQRLFGVGTLTVQHRTQAAVVLKAVQNPEAVRDILRRAGQIEASRFDKANWR